MWFGAAYFPCLSTRRLRARPAVHIESAPKLLKKYLDFFPLTSTGFGSGSGKDDEYISCKTKQVTVSKV